MCRVLSFIFLYLVLNPVPTHAGSLIASDSVKSLDAQRYNEQCVAPSVVVCMAPDEALKASVCYSSVNGVHSCGIMGIRLDQLSEVLSSCPALLIISNLPNVTYWGSILPS